MDDATLTAARQGDRDAQDRLLRELQDPWFRFGLSLLGNAEAAREATQETAFRFLARLSQFRGESSVLTWSMGIAVNVAREMRRVKTHVSDDQILAAERSSALSPESEAQNTEMKSLLKNLLNGLPERQREAVTLRFFHDMSVEETAKAMGCAGGTIKATIHQALRKLRAKMNQMS